MEEIKKLRRITGEFKSNNTNLTNDLTDFLDTASHTKIAGMKTTLNNTLMRVKKLNETLYEMYNSQLS